MPEYKMVDGKKVLVHKTDQEGCSDCSEHEKQAGLEQKEPDNSKEQSEV